MRTSGESTKGFYLRQARLWHSISAALALAGIFGFAVTGVTLNHAGVLQSAPRSQSAEVQLSAPSTAALAALDTAGTAALPAEVAVELAQKTGQSWSGRDAELSADEIYIPLTRAGGDGSLAIDRESGLALLRQSDHGWVGTFNDLHKGRGTGLLWTLFVDVLALAIVVFSLSGLVLLWQQAKRRKSTWPLIGSGLVLPAMLVVFALH